MNEKEIAKIIIEAFKRGNKLLVCGNGGSASMSQHMAAELVCKYKYDRKALPAIALTTDTSIITAWANDFSFGGIFNRQVEALGKEGDVLLTLSTSGNSANVLSAMMLAEAKKLKVISLPCKGKDTPEIQENHLKMIHKICEIVEKAFL